MSAPTPASPCWLAKPAPVDENLGPLRLGEAELAAMGARLNSCAIALAATVLGASAAHAATTPAAIPAECGSRAAFDAELRARLGADARTSDVSVTIAPRAHGFHLRVAIGAEQRELEDPSCTELFRAAIVIAVSMLLQNVEHEPQAPAPSPKSEVAARPPSAPRPSRPRFTVGLGAGLAAGTLPEPVLALELEGKVLWRFLGLGASVRYLLPAQQRDETRQGADLSALGGGVTGIFRPSSEWEARLGFAAQQLWGSGVGRNSGYTATVVAAGPTLGLAWVPLRHGPLWAGLGGEGQLNVARGRFEILNYSGELTGEPTVIYQVPWLAAGAFVRLGLVW